MPTIRPRPPKRDPFPQTFFGLQQERPVYVGNFDFEQKYPEDARYQEVGPNARVWRVYQDEAEVFDADMVGEARDSLDVLLVFAGLFSAVLTTFVAQTSQSLRTDFAAISTSALIEITLVLRAQFDGVSLGSIPATVPTSSSSSLDVWVNGLWFVSLTLSLGAALLAVLVKQWLRQYMSMISGTLRDRSHIRQYRFDGLQKWHVLTFVAVMPIILHVALALFLAGLVLFIIPLRPLIAGFVGAITLLVYGTYIVTNVLPLLRTQCPYRTPFSDVLNVIRHAISSLFTPKSRAPFVSLREGERAVVTADVNVEEAGVEALEWLMAITSNPPTKSVVLQSLGGFSPLMTKKLQKTGIEIPDDLVCAELGASTEHSFAFSVTSGSEAKMERLIRAQLHLPTPRPNEPSHPIADVTDPALQAVIVLSNFDIPNHSSSSMRLDAFSFLTSRIFMYHDDPDGLVLPRLVWDALVRAAIQKYKVFYNGGTALANPHLCLRLCEMVSQTFDLPLDVPAKSLDLLLPINQCLDDLVCFVLHHNADTGPEYPAAHRLAVMLVVSDHISTPRDNPWTWTSILFMMRETWQALGDRDRMKVYNLEQSLLLRKKATELLQGSESVFNPCRCEAIPSQYHDSLAACWLDIFQVYYQLSVSHGVFLPESFTLSSTTLRAIVDKSSGLISGQSLRSVVDELWTFALKCNHPDAFDAVLDDDVLATLTYHGDWRASARRATTFISGVARQPERDADSVRYIEYLTKPEQLLGACWVVAAADLDQSDDEFTNRTLKDDIMGLIKLSSQSPSWEFVRARLRSHLEQHSFKRYSDKETSPPPIQPLIFSESEFDPALPVFDFQRRIQFLRNLARVREAIEDYFAAEPDSSLHHHTLFQRFKMVLRSTLEDHMLPDSNDTNLV